MDIKEARKNVIEQQIRPWGGLNVRANQALSDTPRENLCQRNIKNSFLQILKYLLMS